jgi:hypothetical protein
MPLIQFKFKLVVSDAAGDVEVAAHIGSSW